MKLICGLGNPGTEYRNTRHNVGFMICEILSRRHGLSLVTKKFNGLVGTGRIGGESVTMILPQIYMNRSGRSVASALNFFKIEPDDLIIIHDDVDLEVGRIAVRQGGGTAGHKGLRSIVEETGENDFIRIRFGIGRPEDPRYEVSDFVLSRFTPEEQEQVTARLETAADAVEAVLAEGMERAASRYNVRDFH